MITAIPMNANRISGHFSKADSFVCINERGEEISRHANPALDAGCTGKQALLELLAQQGVGRIVIRNVGQQMLGKLLSLRFAVFQTRGEHTLAELGDPKTPGLLPMTEMDQGRVSLSHEAKKKEGGCNNEQHRHEAGRCCQRKGHVRGRDHVGHGHCCHQDT